MGIKIGDVARKEKRDTAAKWATNVIPPLEGEWCIETDTGNVKIGDGLKLYPALGYHISLPQTYDISSSNTVIALPNITGLVQRQTYYWSGGDGSNTFSFTVSDAATIDGVAATLWIGEGKGLIALESDGSSWQVVDYTDRRVAGDWTIDKYRNGDEIQDSITESLTTTGGWNTITLGRAFVSAILRPLGNTLSDTISSISFKNPTTTTIEAYNEWGATINAHIRIIGRWRT